MNPATAAALTTALVWSRILDAMLLRAHADKKLQIRARIAKAW
jgi:hypothetical protein